MALEVYKGSFTAEVNTGSKAYTGLPFQPKAMLFWLTKQTAAGYAAGRFLSFGFSDGTNDRMIALIGNDATTVAADLSARTQKAAVLAGISYATSLVTTQLQAELTTFDASGFTLNYIITDAAQNFLVHYLALGGSDITNSYVGTILSPAGSTGVVNHTGFGFQPEMVLVATLGIVNDLPASATGGRFSLGATDGTRQQSLCVHQDTSIPTVSMSRQLATRLVDVPTAAGGTTLAGAFSSFLADGIAIDWTTVAADQRRVFVLALRGGQYYVGNDTQRTSTGTQDKTVGFTPTGLLTLGINQVASTGAYEAAKLSVGASDGTRHGGTWGEGVDNVSTSNENSSTYTDKVLRHASSDSTLDADATVSFGATTYTMSWTVNTASAKEFVPVAFGSEAGAPPSRVSTLGLTGAG